RFDALQGAFPEYIDAKAVRLGNQGKVLASIVDPGLRELLGKTIELNFDQAGWKPAAFLPHLTTVYMEGEYQVLAFGQTRMAPLLVRFREGRGTVIFTSFHNSEQNKEQEIKLLKYMVFSAVTARVDAELARKMTEGGLSPTRSSLISASRDNPKVTN